VPDLQRQNQTHRADRPLDLLLPELSEVGQAMRLDHRDR
jgi:hypothetical protein